MHKIRYEIHDDTRQSDFLFLIDGEKLSKGIAFDTMCSRYRTRTFLIFSEFGQMDLSDRDPLVEFGAKSEAGGSLMVWDRLDLWLELNRSAHASSTECGEISSFRMRMCVWV